MWKNVESKVDKTCVFAARQRENGGVHIGMDVFHSELLIQALHGAFRGVVVLAKVAKHDVLHARMIDFGNET